ncbi:MAG: DNA polymerase I [Oscillospiraceae bacterium]|jgi:DNA polymerase-1
MKFLVLDGNSITFRAFYGIKLLTTRDGKYTNAVYGFMNIFLKLLDEVQPDAVACAFDTREKTFRHKMYPEYKAGRKPMPPELAEQLPEIQSLISWLGYKVVTCPGYEADDIIGTFSAKCSSEGWKCYIATGDRDSLQLISDSTSVLLATTHFGRGETTEWTPDVFRENYGIDPDRFIYVKALMGDKSDNIPGVAGIGEKTALALIKEFGSLDGIYENIDSPSIKQGVRDKLIKGKESAYFSLELSTISKEAPVPLDLEGYKKEAGDPASAVGLLSELEMPSIIRRLSLDADNIKPSAERPAEKRIPEVSAGVMTDGDLEGLSEVFVDPQESGVFVSSGEKVWKAEGEVLDRLLCDGGISKKCSRAKPLWKYAEERGIHPEGIDFDLEVAAYLINPSSPDYSSERLRVEYGVSQKFSCQEDGSIGWLEPLCAAVSSELSDKGMNDLLNTIELPLTRVLASMEHEGFLIDTAGIEDFGKMLDRKIADEQNEIYILAGREFNINSPKQLGTVLFDELDLPYGRKTKSGWATDAKTLDSLKGAYPIVDHILSYRTYAKLKSTYVEGLLKAADPAGRVHTDFRQTEARTGRISSTNPNLQNIPVRTELGSELRKFFRAGEGKILLDADYSQIELRVLASMSGDERMIDAFRSGRDIHTETASSIFRVPQEDVTPELRRKAKAVNFGIVYGIGAYSLSQNTGVSMREASQYIEDYFRTYSGVKKYLEGEVEFAKQNGYVQTMFGRRRGIPELKNSNRQVQALGKRLAMNTPIQGTAADIIKLAMIRVCDRLAKEKLDAKLILQVHDELIIESSLECSQEAASILKDEMEKVVDLAAPLTVEVGSGKTWYEAK